MLPRCSTSGSVSVSPPSIRPRLEQLTASDAGRKALSGWTLSSVMEFSSGRPYAGLLSPACTSPAPLSFNTCNGVVVNNVL